MGYNGNGLRRAALLRPQEFTAYEERRLRVCGTAFYVRWFIATDVTVCLIAFKYVQGHDSCVIDLVGVTVRNPRDVWSKSAAMRWSARDAIFDNWAFQLAMGKDVEDALWDAIRHTCWLQKFATMQKQRTLHREGAEEAGIAGTGVTIEPIVASML